MTDNRSLRHADRAPATFSDDDPLAELARIASEFEAAAPSDEREAADYSDDAMAFDLEAELMRSFESDAAHARPAESDRAEPSQDVRAFGEAANQDEAPRDAPVSDLTPEEIPAFLKSRPAEEAAGFDEPAAEDQSYAEEVPAAPARAEEAHNFAAAEDVTTDEPPSASRNDDIADEWTDLPEWPQARSSARRASPAEPIEKIDLGPPAPAAESFVPEEPESADIEPPQAAAATPEPAPEPVAAVEPVPAAMPEDDLPPPIERVSEEAHENHDIIRSFSDHHDDWAEIEEQEDDAVEPTQWAEEARGVVDEPEASSANEPYVENDPVDSDPIWRDFQNYAVPSQSAPVEPESVAPAADPVDEWDIAADLERVFSDYDGGRAAGPHHDDQSSEDFEPSEVDDLSDAAAPAALVVDEVQWDSNAPSAEEADEAEVPVAHVPHPDEHAAPFEAVEPLDADETVIGNVDAGYAAVDGQAALDAPAEADALRIDEDEMAAMAIDFDDLELEMQAVAATLGEEPASQVVEPTVVAESAPPPGGPAMATPPIPVRQPEPAYTPAPRPAPHVVAAAAPVVAARDSDLVFDTGEVTDTSTFIEPVAALDIPDLPEVETPPAAAVDPDLSELEAEFADILATEPPQRAQAEPAPVAATPDSNFDFANYEFADFDSYPANEAREGHGAGTAGGAAMPADLAFDDFDNDAPAEATNRSGGGDSRKWVLLAGGLVLLAGVSFAGYAFMGGSSTDGGAPPVIAANDEPYKVVPEDPGGRAVPNQDQAVYDRVAGRFGDGNANLVSRTEEPIDVVQRTLDPQVLPLEGRPDEGDPAGMEMPAGEPPAEAAAPQATTVDGLLSEAGADDSADAARFGLEPRVVSTMVVRPDGTLVPADSLDADAGGTAQETASAGDPAPAAPLDDPEARLAPATEIEDLLAPPRSVETTTLTPEGEPAATEPAAPEQERASAEPDAGTETAATGGLVGEGAAFANPGGYVVQIASQPSEESARSTYQSLSGRYASIIGDRQAQIQAADIPDRGTFYRVRVAGGTRDEAVALCERYQAAGGSCFVAQ